MRQARVGPHLEALHNWLQTTLIQVSKKSALTEAIRYALTRWTALTRYCGDGCLEIDNNAAERALRAVARITCSRVPIGVANARRQSTP